MYKEEEAITLYGHVGKEEGLKIYKCGNGEDGNERGDGSS